MKFSKLFLVALGSISLFVSCTDDSIESGSEGEFDNGVFILNEGGSGQGSVSFISNDLMTVSQNIYADVNPGDVFGRYAQNIFFSGDNAYIIVGGTNTINVVNRYTFKLVDKIETGLVNPRYGVIANGKAYVVNANTYSFANPTSGNTDDYVAVINLSTNTIESNIALNATGNRIILENGKLYVTEPYNSDKVLVINPATNALEAPITIGDGGDSMEVNNGFLYVLRAPSDPLTYENIEGGLVKIKLSDKTKTEIAFPTALIGAKNLDIYDNKIYYTKGNSVYAMDITATTPSTSAILTYTSTFSSNGIYGFAVNNNHFFIADGGDFTANSNAYVYSLTGTLEKTLNVGVGPNGFYFNN